MNGCPMTECSCGTLVETRNLARHLKGMKHQPDVKCLCGEIVRRSKYNYHSYTHKHVNSIISKYGELMGKELLKTWKIGGSIPIVATPEND